MYSKAYTCKLTTVWVACLGQIIANNKVHVYFIINYWYTWIYLTKYSNSSSLRQQWKKPYTCKLACNQFFPRTISPQCIVSSFFINVLMC